MIACSTTPEKFESFDSFGFEKNTDSNNLYVNNNGDIKITLEIRTEAISESEEDEILKWLKTGWKD